MLIPPLPVEEAAKVELVKGPNIQTLPPLDVLPDRLELPIMLKVGDNISTDEIMPPVRAFCRIAAIFPRSVSLCSRLLTQPIITCHGTKTSRDLMRSLVAKIMDRVQSCQHTALAPRYLGLRMVIAKSFARIHRMNLVNFGILPVIFSDPSTMIGWS